MSVHEDILAAVETYVAESAKFDSGNKSAGTRARAALQEIKNQAQARRLEIQAIKNGE
jgi:hypothetical protein|tara:strand:- start:446 stop:619 length:174 start_codon:yes stop_codon:yes gene_type:complete